MSLEQAQKALDKVKIQLMSRQDTVFITTVCFNLKHRFSDEVPTAGVNGIEVVYNPDFFLAQSPAKQLGLVLHETWHVVFGHVGELSRLGDRDHKKWNIAGDFVINNMLDNQKIELPDGGLLDHQYDPFTTEQVYAKLPDPPKDNSDGFQMDLQNGQGSPEEQQAALEDILVQASLKASMAGNDPGSIPGEIQVKIDELTNPKIPWHRILTKYFTSMVKDDYTFRRPNRRFLPEYILPSAYSEALGQVAMAVDMSGSVSDEETKQFITDVHQVIKQIRLKTLDLVQFDTRVFQVDTIKTVDELMRIKFAGRGGTSIDPVMKWGLKNKPDVMTVFTDGYFRPASIDPEVPVIWIIYDNPNFTAPFGKVIHYEF